jgi:hypothetical protein
MVPAAIRDAMQQDVDHLASTRRNGGPRPMPPDIGQRFAHPFED